MQIKSLSSDSETGADKKIEIAKSFTRLFAILGALSISRFLPESVRSEIPLWAFFSFGLIWIGVSLFIILYATIENVQKNPSYLGKVLLASFSLGGLIQGILIYFLGI